MHNELHMNEQRRGQMTLKKGACCEKANMLALIPVFLKHFKSLSDEQKINTCRCRKLKERKKTVYYEK